MTFDDPSSYTFEGTTRDVHTCDACGKTDLPRTFILIDSHGETLHLGSECAGKALGLSGAPRTFAAQLRKMQRPAREVVPTLMNERDVPRAIEGEMRNAMARAVAAGAGPRLEFVGAGMTGIVLSDGKRAYKVARHSPDTLAEEAEWFVDAAKVPFVKDHVPANVQWDEKNGVIVRDFVDGRRGGWSDESKLFELHQKIGEQMRKAAGWSAPEFKGDSYIITPSGKPILIDGSMPHRVGKNLVGYVEDVLDGKRVSREPLSDLAFALRAEIVAKHNPRGSVPAKDVMRLLKRMREAGVQFDPSWERED